MRAITLDVRIAPGDIAQVSSSVFSEPQEYPGDASGVPARSQGAPEIQKMILEALRARPQDLSETVFDNFCELFVLELSFH